MTHLACLLICIVAFAALALATDRAQSDVFGKELPTTTSRLLRTVGGLLLLGCLAVVVGAWGWSLGLVNYSGYTSLAAAVVFLALIVQQRRKN
ncbi:Protein of unknown function [Roseateles sp. YR242]|uniref:DUF3325 domain-containing protein n=1 Tax=Roseateles sp. YR242 TaxID=1855305 RepID=UPI0008CF6910|nr:DUF3325 domain-containing protein [Roseateles sp. YR242]SEK23379.1 Protein of unknown function [Roseateles sp. YR242]